MARRIVVCGRSLGPVKECRSKHQFLAYFNFNQKSAQWDRTKKISAQTEWLGLARIRNRVRIGLEITEKSEGVWCKLASKA